MFPYCQCQGMSGFLTKSSKGKDKFGQNILNLARNRLAPIQSDSNAELTLSKCSIDDDVQHKEN